MDVASNTAPGGSLGLSVSRAGRPFVEVPDLLVQWPHLTKWSDKLRHALPADGLSPAVNAWRKVNAPRVLRGVAKIAAVQRFAKSIGAPVQIIHGELWLDVIRGDGTVEPLGLASVQMVTDLGVAFLVDAWGGTVEMEIMRFHGYGTGGAAEAVGNTALSTELTTQYVSDSTRPTGTLAENAANIFETVATLSPDSGGTLAITEHGIFSASSAGTLWDRSLFAAVNVVASADSLQTTYRATFTSGG